MRMRWLALLVPLALVSATACDDNGSEPTGPYDLVFEGDASFQSAHGGQEIRVALVSGGAVESTMDGTVSGTADPAFSFTFADALEAGRTYEVHYWIDSNFGDGGLPAVCDETASDHQWSVAVPAASSDVALTETHRPAETEDVCATFAADLTFRGDASFQGAHGGQAIQAGVVRASDGALVMTRSGTVSADADPSFALEFPGALLKDMAYEVHYWIDSNFGGGTEGTCDPVDVDHQWSVELGSTTEDAVTHTESHVPAEQSAVCSTFD